MREEGWLYVGGVALSVAGADAKLMATGSQSRSSVVVFKTDT